MHSVLPFLFLLCHFSFPSEAPPHGFGKINFGDTKEQAIQKLVEKYDYKQVGNAIKGNNNSTLNNSQKTVWITNFPLSRKHQVTVWFHFNSNEKFYKYEIESEGVIKEKTDEKIQPIAKFMSKVFQKKFGHPDKKYELSYLNLKEGYISIYQKWDFKNSQSFIAYKLTGRNCHVVASTRNTALENEKPSHSTAVKTNAEVDEAANSF